MFSKIKKIINTDIKYIFSSFVIFNLFLKYLQLFFYFKCRVLPAQQKKMPKNTGNKLFADCFIKWQKIKVLYLWELIPLFPS